MFDWVICETYIIYISNAIVYCGDDEADVSCVLASACDIVFSTRLPVCSCMVL